MHPLRFVLVLSLVLLIVGGVVWSDRSRESASTSPRELGPIRWNRNLDDATRVAQRDNKPLLVLFQEVPGCATCTAYGDAVLSHPLVHEAAETLFVPVALYNNTSDDDDHRWLTHFDERAFNNPVVRILSTDHTDLAPRVDGDYSVGGIAHAMIAGLEKSNRDVPK